MNEINYEKTLENSIIFQNSIQELFFEIGTRLKPLSKSFQLMSDDSFSKRRDRVYNDIHLFIELNDNKGYFHLKAYCEQTILHIDVFNRGFIYLTGYRKKNLELHNGSHSFEQNWYKRDAQQIIDTIIIQNKDLFN